jgi:hypothetical protein
MVGVFTDQYSNNGWSKYTTAGKIVKLMLLTLRYNTNIGQRSSRWDLHNITLLDYYRMVVPLGLA